MFELRSQTPKGRRARDAILAAAESLFVTHGFHGTSVRDVAAAAGLPLATVVYHFARKEQLYAAILDAIGAELIELLDAIDRLLGSLSGELTEDKELASKPTGADREAARRSERRLDAFAHTLVRWTQDQPGRVQLLLRELLDNPPRVSRATRLPLAPFLKSAAEIVAAGQRHGGLAPQPPELAVLHLVGALSYVVAARPTVDRIVGRARARELAAVYEAEALALASRVLGFEPTKPRRGSS